MPDKLNIALLLGGPSAEREVSLHSGAAVVKALRSLGHDVFEIDPREGSFELPPKTEVVFLALHGTYGEDGTVQTQLEELGVPYTGCGPEASGVAFDKLATKRCCVAEGISTPRYAVLDAPDAAWPPNWEPPVVLKPLRQGSSVGLQFVDQRSQWSAALAEAFRHDTQVLMEERILGRETTVAILGDEVFPVVEIRPKQGVYDFANKYTAGRTEYFCPAPFNFATTEAIQSAALGAFRAIGGGDYARVDVMVRPTGEPLVLEVNTLPGMTETSLLPKAAAAAGLTYAGLCQRMIDLAMERCGAEQRKVT